MNNQNRIPEKRPILFELFCPKCGGSLYAIDEEEFYIGRHERKSPAGFSITKLECVLCREVFDVHDIGLKYEKSIADELGWPFPVEIPNGPNAIPEHVEKRMRKREQEPDPRGDSIDDFYADYYDRSPSPFEKEVIRRVLKRKGHFIRESMPVMEIVLLEKDGFCNARITEIDTTSGFVRKRLPRVINASDYEEGEIIESSSKNSDGSTNRIYYIILKNQFQPIAESRKHPIKS